MELIRDDLITPPQGQSPGFPLSQIKVLYKNDPNSLVIFHHHFENHFEELIQPENLPSAL